MRVSQRTALTLALILSAIGGAGAVASCAGAPRPAPRPTPSPSAQFVERLRAAKATYDETLAKAEAAHAAGRIGDAELASLMQAALDAAAAGNAAQETLAVYLAASPTPTVETVLLLGVRLTAAEEAADRFRALWRSRHGDD